MDKKIPIPKPRLSIVEQFRELEVGESVLLSIENRQQVQTALSREKRISDRAYTVRKVNDKEMRVWRTQ